MGFLHPGLLPLAALAAIPLAIHILSRLRLRRRPFPSLLLLQAVKREKFSWLRLKEILLLVLRTLLLLALLLALSRPHLKVAVPGLVRAGDLVLVLDDSYSMSCGTRWERAVDQARRHLRSAGPGHRTALFTASGAEVRTGPDSRKTALALLDTLRPFASSPTLKQALARAIPVAESLGAPAIVITDLQNRAIPRDMSIPERTRVVLENAAANLFENAGISRLYPEPGPGHTDRVSVEVANYGHHRLSRTLSFELDGRTDERSIELEAGERRTVVFESAAPGSDETVCRAWLDPDSLPVDDERFLVISPPRETPVLVVESGRVTGRYVRMVLEADSVSGFTPFVIDAAELGRTSLDRFDAVVLTDPFALGPGDWNRMEFYLRSGGACLLAAGLAPAEPASLGGRARNEGMSRTAGFVSVASVDTAHPVFAGLDLQAFASTRVWQHSMLNPEGQDVLARLSDGDPLVLESPDRRLIAWSVGPTPEFSDLVYKAAFVPLLCRSLEYLARQARRTERVAGDTIRLPVESAVPVFVTTPRGRVRMEPQAGRNRAEVVLEHTRSPGIYEIESGQERAVLAVNPLAEEGDLTQASPERLAAQGFEVRPLEPAASADLSQPLLWVAALALLLEMLVLLAERRKSARKPT